MSTEYPAPVYAFPGVHADELGYTPSKGMTLRDYFAAKAMKVVADHMVVPGDGCTIGQLTKSISVVSYMLADAMLEARK